MTVGNRIKRARERAGLSQSELARIAGVTRASVSHWEMDKTHPRPNHIRTIANALNVSQAWLSHGDESKTQDNSTLSTIRTQTVPVMGQASAGVFLSPVSDSDISSRSLVVAANHRYPHAQRFAVEVVGTSMNRHFLPGDYAICVPWDEIGKEFADGDIVFVERQRAGEVEYTVKKVRIIDGKVELWPDSYDERWQERIPLECHEEDTEVRVKGLVLSAHRDFVT